ncbi:hypothetical protein JCM16303_001656 [Sporobolomyces ruberrimus]
MELDEAIYRQDGEVVGDAGTLVNQKFAAEAIYGLEQAISLVEEGNKKWPKISYEKKGSSLSPSFLRMMKAELLFYRVEAHRMAETDFARIAFPLEPIETLARDIITEKQPADDEIGSGVVGIDPLTEMFRNLASRVMPVARAHAALGYASAQRAQAPLDPLELEVGTAATADLFHAKEAARSYDLAYKLLPGDYHGKPLIGFKALEQHLRAGGKTVKQVFQLAKEAEIIRQDLVRIFPHLDEEDPARMFVEDRVHYLIDWLASPGARPIKGVRPINLTLQPIPTFNVGADPETADIDSVLTPEWWSKLPGDVGLVVALRTPADHVSASGMAAELKAQGNAHFAKKEWEKALKLYSQVLKQIDNVDVAQRTALLSNRSAGYVHLEQFTNAVQDSQLCIKLRPEWSKAYARCGEAYSRQCNFTGAKIAYGEAIRTAENATVKARYVAARKLVEENQANQQSSTFKPSAARALVQEYHQTWMQRVVKAEKQGFEKHEDGAIGMTLHAWNFAAEAWSELDKVIFRQNGQIDGSPGTLVNQKFAECILIDHLSFAIPKGGHADPNFSFGQKFFELTAFQLKGLPIWRYFQGRRWSAEEIIADLEAIRMRGAGWEVVRTLLSTLIRGSILLAFTGSATMKHAEAIEELQQAIRLVEGGNRKWPNVSYENKGSGLEPTFLRMIKARLLPYRIKAHQMARTDSATTAFSLESIEKLARDIVTERQLPADRVDSSGKPISKLSTHVMPVARAHAALGYVASQRAQAPLDPIDHKVGTAVTVDLFHAREAARSYDLSYKLFPDDYYGKPLVGFKALELHLLAGGKTVKEVFRLAEEAEKLRKDLVRFFVHLDDEEPARTFVEERIPTLRDWLASPSAQPVNGVEPIDLTLKAIPTLNVGWDTDSVDIDSVLTPEYWSKLRGDFGTVIERRTAVVVDGQSYPWQV